MRYVPVIVALIFNGTSSASAEELLVEACKRAVAHFYMWKLDEVKVAMVNDFSNLKPPRVRLKLDFILSSTVSCTFSSTTKPVGLSEYCTPLHGCLEAGDERFDELAELMRRDGY